MATNTDTEEKDNTNRHDIPNGHAMNNADKSEGMHHHRTILSDLM